MIEEQPVLLTAIPGGADRTAGPAGASMVRLRAIPETLASYAGFGQLLATPGFPIGFLGIIWIGPRRGGSVRFRRANGWGPWQPIVQGDSAGGPRSALVAAGNASGYQISPPPHSEIVQIVAINTTHGRASTRIEQESTTVGEFNRIPFVERAAWGADESLRFDADGNEILPPTYFPVQTVTIHHTTTPNDDPDPAATIRAIYFFNAVTRKAGDLGTHLLIDEAGVIYEGRSPQLTGRPSGSGRHGGAPLICTGAHVGGYNAGNFGISLIGDFTSRTPTTAARGSLVRVLVAVARCCGIDPTRMVSYVNPISDATMEIPAIAGHSSWSPAECPGDTLHGDLPSLRLDMARQLAASDQ